ncbi:MAG: ABC transporter substrate binding protein [Erysipelotrichaceae bacterium]|nr:ABC transporter substrate binding protein [Erysipelotrichaceae bacterium]
MKKLLVILLAICCAFSLVACGSKEENQPNTTDNGEKTLKVGVIQLLEHDALDAATQGFCDAVEAALGDKLEGGKVVVQNAQGEQDICKTIANGYVSDEYDLIMGNATPALLSAKNATDTIPVLGTSVTDYASALELDLVDGATGINVSGTSDGVPAQAYVDCLLEVVPEAKKVLVVYCSAEPNSVVQSDNFVAAMNATNPAVEVVVKTFDDSNDMRSVIAGNVDGVDALYIPTDNTAAANMTNVSGVCEPLNIPVICGEEGMCNAGGTATVSISYYNIGKVCGEMAVAILNGADVSKMAVGYDNEPVKKYNAANVAAIGITMPEGYVAIGE